MLELKIIYLMNYLSHIRHMFWITISALAKLRKSNTFGNQKYRTVTEWAHEPLKCLVLMIKCTLFYTEGVFFPGKMWMF